jgi:hypothetical protein
VNMRTCEGIYEMNVADTSADTHAVLNSVSICMRSTRGDAQPHPRSAGVSLT